LSSPDGFRNNKVVFASGKKIMRKGQPGTSGRN